MIGVDAVLGAGMPMIQMGIPWRAYVQLIAKAMCPHMLPPPKLAVPSAILCPCPEPASRPILGANRTIQIDLFPKPAHQVLVDERLGLAFVHPFWHTFILFQHCCRRPLSFHKQMEGADLQPMPLGSKLVGLGGLFGSTSEEHQHCLSRLAHSGGIRHLPDP